MEILKTYIWGAEEVPIHQLLQEIETIPADLKLIILDACQMNKASRSRGPKVAPSFSIGKINPFRSKGTVIVRSTRQGEPALESDYLGGAIFSHYFFSALRGAGDHDHNGQVTFLEAYSYAYHHTVFHSAQGPNISSTPLMT